MRNIAEVTTAVARGDLSRKITVDVKGEILELKNTINTMVDQLNVRLEWLRVAREVGTEGRLGGQAQVPGVAGTWKEPHRQRQLDGRQPHGAGAQHRRGVDRHRQRRPVEDHRQQSGEILQLKETTINLTVDQLNAFAGEVTRVAARGRHRRQAQPRPTCAASPPGRT